MSFLQNCISKSNYLLRIKCNKLSLPISLCGFSTLCWPLWPKPIPCHKYHLQLLQPHVELYPTLVSSYLTIAAGIISASFYEFLHDNSIEFLAKENFKHTQFFKRLVGINGNQTHHLSHQKRALCKHPIDCKLTWLP